MKHRKQDPQQKELETLLRHYPSLAGEVSRLLAVRLPASFGPLEAAPDTPASKAAREQRKWYSIPEKQEE